MHRVFFSLHRVLIANCLRQINWFTWFKYLLLLFSNSGKKKTIVNNQQHIETQRNPKCKHQKEYHFGMIHVSTKTPEPQGLRWYYTKQIFAYNTECFTITAYSRQIFSACDSCLYDYFHTCTVTHWMVCYFGFSHHSNSFSSSSFFHPFKFRYICNCDFRISDIYSIGREAVIASHPIGMNLKANSDPRWIPHRVQISTK